MSKLGLVTFGRVKQLKSIPVSECPNPWESSKSGHIKLEFKKKIFCVTKMKPLHKKNITLSYCYVILSVCLGS